MAVIKSYLTPYWLTGSSPTPTYSYICSTEAELPTSGFSYGDSAFANDTGRTFTCADGSSWSLSSQNLKAITAAAPTSGTGETVLFTCRIPANVVRAGSTFKIRCAGASSSTGTLNFRVRVGANGTTSDAQAWVSATSVAQVANAHAGFDVSMTVRVAGAIGAVMVDGAAHAGAVLLPTLVGAPATAAVATNAAWFITVTATCSVGAYSAQVGFVEAI